MKNIFEIVCICHDNNLQVFIYPKFLSFIFWCNIMYFILLQLLLSLVSLKTGTKNYTI